MADPLDALRLPIVPVEPRLSFAADLLRRIQRAGPPARDSATVRYFADDVDVAVAFYRQLGFEVELRPSPAAEHPGQSRPPRWDHARARRLESNFVAGR
jgi:hypothetical protein